MENDKLRQSPVFIVRNLKMSSINGDLVSYCNVFYVAGDVVTSVPTNIVQLMSNNDVYVQGGFYVSGDVVANYVGSSNVQISGNLYVQGDVYSFWTTMPTSTTSSNAVVVTGTPTTPIVPIAGTVTLSNIAAAFPGIQTTPPRHLLAFSNVAPLSKLSVNAFRGLTAPSPTFVFPKYISAPCIQSSNQAITFTTANIPAQASVDISTFASNVPYQRTLTYSTLNFPPSIAGLTPNGQLSINLTAPLSTLSANPAIVVTNFFGNSLTIPFVFASGTTATGPYALPIGQPTYGVYRVYNNVNGLYDFAWNMTCCNCAAAPIVTTYGCTGAYSAGRLAVTGQASPNSSPWVSLYMSSNSEFTTPSFIATTTAPGVPSAPAPSAAASSSSPPTYVSFDGSTWHLTWTLSCSNCTQALSTGPGYSVRSFDGSNVLVVAGSNAPATPPSTTLNLLDAPGGYVATPATVTVTSSAPSPAAPAPYFNFPSTVPTNGVYTSISCPSSNNMLFTGSYVASYTGTASVDLSTMISTAWGQCNIRFAADGSAATYGCAVSPAGLLTFSSSSAISGSFSITATNQWSISATAYVGLNTTVTPLSPFVINGFAFNQTLGNNTLVTNVQNYVSFNGSLAFVYVLYTPNQTPGAGGVTSLPSWITTGATGVFYSPAQLASNPNLLNVTIAANYRNVIYNVLVNVAARDGYGNDVNAGSFWLTIAETSTTGVVPLLSSPAPCVLNTPVLTTPTVSGGTATVAWQFATSNCTGVTNWNTTGFTNVTGTTFAAKMATLTGTCPAGATLTASLTLVDQLDSNHSAAYATTLTYSATASPPRYPYWTFPTVVPGATIVQGTNAVLQYGADASGGTLYANFNYPSTGSIDVYFNNFLVLDPTGGTTASYAITSGALPSSYVSFDANAGHLRMNTPGSLSGSFQITPYAGGVAGPPYQIVFQVTGNFPPTIANNFAADGPTAAIRYNGSYTWPQAVSYYFNGATSYTLSWNATNPTTGVVTTGFGITVQGNNSYQSYNIWSTDHVFVGSLNQNVAFVYTVTLTATNAFGSLSQSANVLWTQ